MITLYAFRRVPDFAKGHDLRVRWALEEAGIPYRERLIRLDERTSADYLAIQPFDQVPAIEEDGMVQFESGAIVLGIARHSKALMPADPAGRTHTNAWAFAALNSVEPAIASLTEMDIFAEGKAWTIARRPVVVELAQERETGAARSPTGRPRPSGGSVRRLRPAEDDGAARPGTYRPGRAPPQGWPLIATAAWRAPPLPRCWRISCGRSKATSRYRKTKQQPATSPATDEAMAARHIRRPAPHKPPSAGSFHSYAQRRSPPMAASRS